MSLIPAISRTCFASELPFFLLSGVAIVSVLMALPGLFLTHKHYSNRNRILSFEVHSLGTVFTAALIFLCFAFMLTFPHLVLLEPLRLMLKTFPVMWVFLGIAILYITCLTWIRFDAVLRHWFYPVWEPAEAPEGEAEA